MDYLNDFGSAKKKLPAIQAGTPALSPKPAVQGEIVTPTPANYTAQKALPNYSSIDGSVSRPALSPKPAVQIPSASPAQSPATPMISQKVSMPPYNSNIANQAANAVNQYGKIPPVTTSGGGITAKPVNLSGMASKVIGGIGAAMPAIQSGMNASAIMNQENDFAKKIHAGSIADPNYGQELMGDKPQLSRAITPPISTTTPQPMQGGRGFTVPEMPDQYINSRAGKSVNPAYTQYMANHPATPTQPASQSPVAHSQVSQGQEPSPINYTPPNYSLSNPNKPLTNRAEILLNGESPAVKRMPTSMNDVTSGTGYIKASSGGTNHNPIFDKGMGFVQNETGMMGSDGKQRTPQRGLSMPTISNNQMDVNVLDRLSAQRANGSITAAQAGQIYAQHQAQNQNDAIQEMPLEQRAKAAMQLSAGRGNVQAAQQLSTAQHQQGTLDNQKQTLDAQNEQTQYARNTPAQKAEDVKNNLHLELIGAIQSGNEAQIGKAASAIHKYNAATSDPKKVGLRKVSTDNGTDGKRTEEIAMDEYTGQDIPQPAKTAPFDTSKEKELTDSNGKRWARQED